MFYLISSIPFVLISLTNFSINSSIVISPIWPTPRLRIATLLLVIYVDTNGDEEPNVFGKDRFTFGVNFNGIIYD